MSGHSKWAQIKRQKGVTDVKRSQAFTKLSNAISIAVKQGGGVPDTESNFKLRLAVDRARALNMPKENIERAIQRAMGKSAQEMEDGIYEGFGPGGVAIIVEVVTDKKLRTTGELKNMFEKNGGALASPGAVSYQFQQKGLITVGSHGMSLDDVIMVAAESGAEDVEEAKDQILVYTNPEQLNLVKEQLLSRGIKVITSELTRQPLTTVSIDNKESAQKVLSFIERIEESDDVQKVYSNFDISDSLFSELK